MNKKNLIYIIPAMLLASCGQQIQLPVINSKVDKTVDVLMYNSSTSDFEKTDTDQYTFINGSLIPYYSLEYYVNKYLNCSANNASYSFSSNGTVATISLLNQNKTVRDYATIDYSKQIVTYSRYAGFFCNSLQELKPMEFALNMSTQFYGNQMETTFTPGVHYSIHLNEYNTKLYQDGNKFYLPYKTCDILFNMNNEKDVPLYNGVCSYLISFDNEKENLTPIKAIRDQATNKDELVTYNYDLFALTLTAKWGLRKKKLRTTNQEYKYFPNGPYTILEPYKTRLLSKEPNVSAIATREIFDDKLNDGGHAGYNNLNLFSTDVLTLQEKGDNKLCNDSQKGLLTERNKRFVIGENESHYKVIANKGVAFFTFDSFMPRSETIDPTQINASNYKSDVTAATYWVNKQIRLDINEKQVKHLVIDMSLNGGGNASFAAFILSWISGQSAEIFLQDAKDTSMLKAVIKSDANLNGIPGEAEDYLPDGLKVYLMTSYATFSTANYLATLIDDYTGVKLIGCNTGGGSCNAYGGLRGGLGQAYRFSGNWILGRKTSTQTIFIPDENGITRDFYYSIPCNATHYANYYNREAISDYILSHQNP